MAPFYLRMCRETHEEPEEGLLRELEGRNRAELEKLEEAMTDAVENLGDVEQRDALMNKAEYLSAIGDKVCIVFIPTCVCAMLVYRLRRGQSWDLGKHLTRPSPWAKG